MEGYVAVIDLGTANFGSMMNMLKKIGAESVLTNSPEQVAEASRLILPGVGAFDTVAAALHQKPELLATLSDRVLSDKVEFLGVCVGMQLLFDSSDEGVQPGLGWIGGRVRKFEFDEASRLPVPHMGWNFIKQVRASRLMNMEEKNKFYFVHSYRAVDVDADAILGTTNYGEDFVSAVSRDNIHGVQFHPEKSHFFGMNILRAFLEG